MFDEKKVYELVIKDNICIPRDIKNTNKNYINEFTNY